MKKIWQKYGKNNDLSIFREYQRDKYQWNRRKAIKTENLQTKFPCDALIISDYQVNVPRHVNGRPNIERNIRFCLCTCRNDMTMSRGSEDVCYLFNYRYLVSL